MTRLLALSGYAGSGKDAAAEALIADGWQRDAFADRMRLALYALNPIVHVEAKQRGQAFDLIAYRLAELVDDAGWDAVKREIPEIRSLLQRFGTEGGRDIYGEDFWVDLVIDSWDRETPMVVADCRFRNEADAVKRAGGIVVRINRPGVGPNTAPDGTVHVSDVALEGYAFGYTIENDGTLLDLRHAIRLVAADPDSLAKLAA